MNNSSQMTSKVSLCSVCIAVLHGIASSCFAQLPPDVRRVFKSEPLSLRAVLDTNDELHLEEGYTAFFAATSPAKIRSLKSQTHTGVALRAAWEEVIRSVKKAKGNRGWEPDRSAIARFIGFVEGRLMIELPQWWEQIMLKCSAQNLVVRPDPPSSIAFGMYAETDIGVRVSPGVMAKMDGDKLVVESGKHRIETRMDSLNVKREQVDLLSVFLDGKQCYLAFHRDTCSSYNLFRLDTGTGKVLWSTRVRTCGNSVIFSGQGFFHLVTMRIVGDELMVFGMGNSLAYIEAFNTRDGKVVFRWESSM